MPVFLLTGLRGLGRHIPWKGSAIQMRNEASHLERSKISFTVRCCHALFFSFHFDSNIFCLFVCCVSLVSDIEQSAAATTRFLVRASYLQIYNEVISDLLKPERINLQIREDKKKGIFVDGLSEWIVRTPQEIYCSFSSFFLTPFYLSFIFLALRSLVSS